MKAFVLSIGESTTGLCVTQLQKFGFDVNSTAPYNKTNNNIKLANEISKILKYLIVRFIYPYPNVPNSIKISKIIPFHIKPGLCR